MWPDQRVTSYWVHIGDRDTGHSTCRFEDQVKGSFDGQYHAFCKSLKSDELNLTLGLKSTNRPTVVHLLGLTAQSTLRGTITENANVLSRVASAFVWRILSE